MTTLSFSITINAPKEKVWHMMLDRPTYEIWTAAFSEGSTYQGSWEKGAKINFVDPEGSGMYSEIAENRPYEFVSIQHLGMLQKGQPDTESDMAKNWKEAFENYTFTDLDGKTQLDIEIQMEPNPEFEAMFSEMWPRALQLLKNLVEKSVTVETTVNAPVEKVWAAWTEPQHITKWCFASDDWEAPSAENDLRVGGTFKTIMAAKDGSFKFDFGGTYTAVKPHKFIAYTMEDGRKVSVAFGAQGNTTKVTETFDIESENSEEKQREGWQAILNNFKKHAENI